MKRKVIYAALHEPLFVKSGPGQLGKEFPPDKSSNKSFDTFEMTLDGDILHILMIPNVLSRLPSAEVAVPIANVKCMTLAPEEKPKAK